MPIYEYRCESCGKVFEFIQKFSDEPLTECPECTGCLSKLISNTSFVLKGSGWYADGYSKGGKSASCAKDSAGGGVSASAMSGSKPDANKPAGEAVKPSGKKEVVA